MRAMGSGELITAQRTTGYRIYKLDWRTSLAVKLIKALVQRFDQCALSITLCNYTVVRTTVMGSV